MDSTVQIVDVGVSLKSLLFKFCVMTDRLIQMIQFLEAPSPSLKGLSITNKLKLTFCSNSKSVLNPLTDPFTVLFSIQMPSHWNRLLDSLDFRFCLF